MDKRKMCDIEEVLDGSRSAGLIVIWPTMHLAELSIIPLREGGDIVFGIAQRDPDPIVALASLIDRSAGLSRRCLIGVSWKTYALPCLVIGPAMIRAHQAVIFDATHREPCPSMQAQVAPGMDLLTCTPQNNIF